MDNETEGSVRVHACEHHVSCPICFALIDATDEMQHVRWHHTMTNLPMTPEQLELTSKEVAILMGRGLDSSEELSDTPAADADVVGD